MEFPLYAAAGGGGFPDAVLRIDQLMVRALVLLALLGAAEHPSYLTGTWFGQGEPNDRSEMWLAHASANGDFAVQFRSCRKGQKANKASDLFQKGTWRFQDGTEYVQITLS